MDARIYLLRHGSAEARDSAGRDRPDRHLLRRGREQAAAVGQLLCSLGRLDRVLVSPYDRALETARLALEAFSRSHANDDRTSASEFSPPEIELCTALSPDGAPEAALASILERTAVGARVLAVGHEPLLSEVAASLIGSGSAIELRKGGLLELELLSRRPPRAALLGLLRPGHLRRWQPVARFQSSASRRNSE